ncbi:NUMOD4 motif-containing HNH endonuclease [Hymenobacter sp. BT175]|uniref:NUMOD4 motif-containing HNH endonuclease n=1 Tax=Hymenobacter translucens TaxID=2886507 RepID=UPI001D0DF683|nr:NUMOD4 motif-containing HNH endonuclease [Hymenobacter translucens]MCC2547733.1 NUMOD4 motif-containing HNH endonuclease [Hymenobacter translucens]
MKKDIENHVGSYQVSDQGQVFSLDRIIPRKGVDKAGNPAPNQTVRGRMLKNYKAKNGYYVVNLGGPEGLKQRYVHELVAAAFIGPRPEGATINHKDGNKLNNTPANLEYCTYAENNEHARGTGLNRVNIADYTMRRRVGLLDENGQVVQEYASAMEAEKLTGTHHVGLACSGKRKTAGGRKWKFL